MPQTKSSNQHEYDKEYLDAVKDSVKNGSYFEDALDWYFFSYVRPIHERTTLIFASILSIFVVVLVVQMILSALPLVERVPVVTAAKDQTEYYSKLIPLRKEGEKEVHVDELVLRYLAQEYVINREAHDYRDASIEKINTKFDRIRNTSSAEEYRNFQLFMSKDNPDSPIKYFGQNAYKDVVIDSVVVVKNQQQQDLLSQARDFFKNIIPQEAEVRFTVTTKIKDQPDLKEKFLVKMSFNFSPVQRLDGNSKTDRFLKFIVTKYQVFKIKS